MCCSEHTAFKKFSKYITIKRQQLEQQPDQIKLSAAMNSLLLNFMPCWNLSIPGINFFANSGWLNGEQMVTPSFLVFHLDYSVFAHICHNVF